MNREGSCFGAFTILTASRKVKPVKANYLTIVLLVASLVWNSFFFFFLWVRISNFLAISALFPAIEKCLHRNIYIFFFLSFFPPLMHITQTWITRLCGLLTNS